ncbi:uncharacterized protein BJX67DRAFT_391757 [Aspergillus lucknowensis]|uniref:C6 finger domain protein n=1 Tax=Aspergillus lucknowensis TaxID=176173 RepID=A0ABR4LYW8_9EURO
MTSRSSAEQDRRSPPSRFEFITVAGSNVAGDDATRRRVRSHAMADYKRRTAQPRRKENETIELDVSPLLDGSLVPTTVPAPRETSREQPIALHTANPMTLLGADRSDPFGTFPINGTYRSRQLWDHMYDGSCIMFRIMRKIGFLDVVRETIALSQLLSTSSRHLGLLLGADSSDAYGYAIQATTSLQGRLADPASCTSDEVVAIVLTFACYANMFRDPELLNIHMNGLDQILASRGGIRSLDTAPLLRIMVYWVDVNGSFMQDTIPRYPQPFTILAARSKLNIIPFEQPSHAAGGHYAEKLTRAQLRSSISELHLIIQSELSMRDLWADVLFPGFHISPILHALLLQSRAAIDDSVEARLEESFRLAAIIYLTELRGLFGIDTVPGQLYVSKLRLSLQDVAPAVYAEPYAVWALTVGACATCLDQELRTWFTVQLAETLTILRVPSFLAFRNVITDFLWCPEALGHALNSLNGQVYPQEDQN